MITLYLARHGQTKENTMRIFQGHLPGELTDEGIEPSMGEKQITKRNRLGNMDRTKNRICKRKKSA